MEVCECTFSVRDMLKAVSGFPEKGLICFELGEDLLIISHLIGGVDVHSIRYLFIKTFE